MSTSSTDNTEPQAEPQAFLRGLVCVECIRQCIREEHVAASTLADYEAVTVTGGEALCMPHLLLRLRREKTQK